MTREKFRDYVEILRSQDEIPYDVYSALIDGIDTLEQEPILDKIRTELIQSIQNGTIKIESGNEELFRILDKYKAESETNIKALEQQSCEDAISRKAILECQYTIDDSETLGISTRNVVNVDDILNAKPVTPQPKTGHWIHLKHNKGKCSKCHDVVLIAQQYGNANYCPNCGAKMVEPHESEEIDADSN